MADDRKAVLEALDRIAELAVIGEGMMPSERHPAKADIATIRAALSPADDESPTVTPLYAHPPSAKGAPGEAVAWMNKQGFCISTFMRNEGDAEYQAAYSIPLYAAPPAAAPQEQVLQFIGWLSGDIPELHNVEVPRLHDSWLRFLAAAPSQPPAAPREGGER